MSWARLVEMDASGSLPALASLLSSVPRPTILVGFVRPYTDLRERLESEGVDLADVFFVDATPHPSLEAFRPDAFFIGSPTMLERVGIVCQKVLLHVGGKAHIVVHDHDAIGNYNGPGMTQQFLHHLITQTDRDGCDLDIMVAGASPELRAMVQDSVHVEDLRT